MRITIPDRPRGVIGDKINEMVYTRVKPVIYTSKSGKPGHFKMWSSRYKTREALRSWTEYANQTEDILVDIEDCINEDITRFVGLAGHDDDGHIERYYTVFKPHSTLRNTSNMD